MEQNPDTISLVLKGPLKLFSTGAKVEQLTQVLVDKGYSLMGTGVYGPMVRRAVKDFQKKNNLKADGVVGQETWSALFSKWNR